jgi:hypothetical protein
MPNEDHGDPANITMMDLESAAEAGGISTQEAVRNIQQGYDELSGQTAAVSGQSTASGGRAAESLAEAGRAAAENAGRGTQTANNEQSFEDRQGGYGGGTTSPH